MHPNSSVGAASSGPGAWSCGETSGACSFLCGATMWKKQLMAPRPCSHRLSPTSLLPYPSFHTLPPTALPPQLRRRGCGWGRTWSEEVLHSQLTRRLPRDPVLSQLSVCPSICILLDPSRSLTTVGILREAGRAELGSTIASSIGPDKGTHRSWKKKT